MRILHTSDWHLGQKLVNQSREAEQQMALEWLLSVIEAEQPDVLLVAGDVFDAHNPPQIAEEQYYSFLAKLKNTACRHVVIIGGNHDAPAKINAPKGLLRALDVHVVGGATDDIQDEIVALRDKDDRCVALIGAVPFLRDRDFQFAAGESPAERTQRIRAGIADHYQRIAEHMAHWPDADAVPRIAMGHLFAKGASATEEQQNIYVGDLENIAADQFSEVFDYVALGHIHRAQTIGKQLRIRYCGSLIPLSFSENKDQKGVLVADFGADGRLATVRDVSAPDFRRLMTLRGSLSELQTKLALLSETNTPLPTWVEIVLEDATLPPGVDQLLRASIAGQPGQILKIRRSRTSLALDEQTPVEELGHLTPEEVFMQRCESKGYSPEDTAVALQTFRELRESVMS
jgi:DNA repair protein SbcD/Mre11